MEGGIIRRRLPFASGAALDIGVPKGEGGLSYVGAEALRFLRALGAIYNGNVVTL